MHANDDDNELLRIQLEGEELEKKNIDNEKIQHERDNRGVPIKRDEDGTVFEWDQSLKGWFPKVDSAFLAAYRLSYGDSNDAIKTEGGSIERSTQRGIDQVRYVHPETRNVYEWNDVKYLWINVKDETDTMAPNVESNNSQKYTDPSTNVEYIWSASMTQWVAETYVDHLTGLSFTWDDGKQEYVVAGELKKFADSKNSDELKNEKPSESCSQGLRAPGAIEKEQNQIPKRKRKEPEWFNIDENQNSNVYVYGLPLDMSQEEFETLMNKYGIIMTDPDTGKPKVKLYQNPDGTMKGDGRCCYLKVESVELALKLLDGLDYRGGRKIGVHRAQFKLKGEFDPTKKKKKRTKKKKGKATQEKLLDWRPEANRLVANRKRCEKVAVLKNVFDARSLMKDVKQIPALQKKVNQACSRFGAIKKVCIFDLHDEGVASIAFRDWDSADMCVSQLDNRQFLGRKITAELWDGVTNYKIVETEEQERARIERWEKELSGDWSTPAQESKSEKPLAESLQDSTLEEMLGLDRDSDDQDEAEDEYEEAKMKEIMANLASGGEIFGSVQSKMMSESTTKENSSWLRQGWYYQAIVVSLILFCSILN